MKRKSTNRIIPRQPKKSISEGKHNNETEIEESKNRDGFSNLISSLDASKKVLKRFLKDDNLLDESVEILHHSNVFESTESTFEDEDDEDYKSEYDEEDVSESEEIMQTKVSDPYKIHFEQEIDEDIMKELINSKIIQHGKMNVTDQEIKETFEFPEDIQRKLNTHCYTSNMCSLDQSKVDDMKEGLLDKWKEFNTGKKKGKLFTRSQKKLYEDIFSYKDVFYHNENHINGEEIRRLYCLHVANHVLKARSRVMKNNAKIAVSTEKSSLEKNPDIYRDQGLTRPKVLIMAPFRDSCLRIVNSIIKFGLTTSKGQVMNRKRFVQEYSSVADESKQSSKQSDDFKYTFKGNIDDCFRIGLTLSKNTVKLYAPFYSADIIVASPLGLRTIIGAESEVQDYDFLSSIEVLILDQADVFLMQNWEHVLHAMDYMNKTPKKSHDTDFMRVRMWCINKWCHYYRQTLLFSNIQSPEQNNLFNRYCYNFNGKIRRTATNTNGSVHQVIKQIPQVYHKIDVDVYVDVADKRFQYFIKKILPRFKNELSTSTVIFVPSYFDFVRIRNYFKKEGMSFVQISEYSKRSNITRSRSQFYEKKKQFLLLTERFHFFYRYKIRGIKHIIFYELPRYPQFYSELINYMDFASTGCLISNMSCTVLFSKFDGSRLERVVGRERCQHMMTSKKSDFMVMTDE